MEHLLKESYLQFIKNSQGVKMFRNFYVLKGGKKKDVLKSGNLSCAFFVSSILLIFGLLKKVCFTIKSTVDGMKKNSWYEIKKLRPGAVLVWEEMVFENGTKHYHIGFCFDGRSAISNDRKLGTPRKHHLNYGIKSGKPVRKILKIFWHNKLG